MRIYKHIPYRLVSLTGLLLLAACQPEDVFENFPEPNKNLIAEVTDEKIFNREAPIPPQCYTRTEQVNNPCYVCHQSYNDNDRFHLNKKNDGNLQGDYAFSDIGMMNQWANLFEDRTEWVKQISDATIMTYVNTENYSALKGTLESSDFEGFIPDLDNLDQAAEAFHKNGLAKDGSHWVAFNYKPFPSTFWPTNGSTDDVMIRLDNKFRELDGQYDESIYFLNLSLLELTFKELDQIDVFTVDETKLGRDINGDGELHKAETTLVKQTHYFGDAHEVATVAQQYPLATEFLHSIRYLGLDDTGNTVIPPRMKELRYMKKIRSYSAKKIENLYWNEHKDKFIEELLPTFADHGDKGFNNGFGWLIHGFIEGSDGNLRPQSFEEKMFCTGCHSAIGSTIDQTFSFARKVTGSKGWGYINLKDMIDAPSVSSNKPEFQEYLSRVGGGDEFRANTEMLKRWFKPDGTLDQEKVDAADIYTLITPSRERALMLNKAYTQIVRHQDYIKGRDATMTPPVNVFNQVDTEVAPLKPEARVIGWDARLRWH